MIYTIQQGDTLSSIAKRFAGNAQEFNTIAAINNIQDPDKILEGQQIIIPKKFNKPLKRAEIPTSNKTQIIDNYSPKYNYIIENDKIYYAIKGRDYWVDISDNDVARKNLYNFVGNKYNFKGYEDEEKKIWNDVKQDKFNYEQYRDSVNSSQKKLISKNTKNTKNTKTLKAAKDINVKTTNYTQSTASSYVNNPHKLFKTIGIDGITVRPPKQSNLNVDDPDSFSLENLFTKAKNWISRQIGKQVDVNEEVTKLDLPYADNKNSDYAIRPGSYTGNDTIRLFKDRRYIFPESIDVTEYQFGHRNRGQYNPIDTEGGIITSFSGFMPYGKHSKGANTYIGINKQGNLIAGDISQFSEGSYLAPTYSNKITRFITDKNGNIMYTPSRKNPGKLQPVAEIIDEKTNKPIINPKSQAINILVNSGDKKGTYGNITGGRILVKVGNELRLLTGSVENIRDEFENMKKRNNMSYGIFYTLDNGSYNIGLRTIDKKLTPKDLKQYDLRNSGGGGNFLYLKSKIIPKNTYKSDTILTPNIRTINSESYKQGHDTINELRGVVLHHTGFTENNLNNVIKHLTNPKNEVSSHVVIGYDGSRKILANPTNVTFHAGASVWNNRDNVNDFMLGIEFQGDTNKKDLTEDQIKSAVEYLKPIIKKYNISLENIVTHKQVRDLYNDFAKKQGKRIAPNKTDINQRNYEKILKELLKQIYYKK